MELTGFAGRSFAVTGGASGIGRATALLIAEAGGRVVAGDVNDETLRELRGMAAEQNLPIVTQKLDVGDPDSVCAFIDVAAERGDLRGAVCAAGISPDRALLDMTLADWDHVLRINLTGTFLVAQATARVLAEGLQGGGAIVTVASAAPHRGTPNLGHYNASKAGVGALTRTMAREFGPLGIRVNCVAPGAVDTPLFRSRVGPGKTPKVSGDIPLGRLGRSLDLAESIVYLLSHQSSWTTGQTLHVNGGTLMP